MANTQMLIAEVYSAFNQRNIDGALALMKECVSWPKASEGGRVVGKDEIRAYWSRQWKEFDPHVEPVEVMRPTRPPWPQPRRDRECPTRAAQRSRVSRDPLRSEDRFLD